MVFSSLLFLYIFLPACLLLYFVFPQKKIKNAALILTSVLFYAWGEPVYVLLLLLSAVLNYAFGCFVDAAREKKGCRTILILCVLIDLAFLLVFKYAGFAAETVNRILGVSLPVPELRLPIGISFYTFQTLTYVVDVYRGKVKKQSSVWRFLLYVSLFPQLIAGPIVRYSEIEPQLERRAVDLEDIFYGVLRFCIGLGKKVLLANYAGRVAAQLLDGNLSGATVVGTWFGVLMFAFEIYFDFSGYSDMAIGLGRVLGFKYSENFDLPYISKSITEFWRRWHISLGGFFRDYVYIPMGGNRRHQFLNLLVVWSLTGLWHGASWNFLLWGLYFFFLLLIEKTFRRTLNHIPGWIRMIFTFAFVVFGWTIFYYTDLGRLWDAVKVMFGGGAVYSHMVGVTLLNRSLLFAVCVLGSTALPRRLGLVFTGLCMTDNEIRTSGRQTVYALGVFLFEIAILFLCTVSLVGSSYNPFLYFRF